MTQEEDSGAIPVIQILRRVLENYALRWDGIHGLTHWGRVLDNGLRLAPETGADPTVVTLFALFHDSRRENDGSDPHHGARGAEFGLSLRGSLFELDQRQAAQFEEACGYHTSGRTDGSATVRTCWDADRLDLPRVFITPDPAKLCTEAGRETVIRNWADDRAIRDHVSEHVRPLFNELRDAKEAH